MTKGEETRKLIVEKSAELFNTKGYDACSMSDIMKVTGLKKGGLYNHFSSKEDLSVEAFDYMFSLIFQMFRKHLDEKKTSIDKLSGIIDAFEELIVSSPIKGGCPVGNAAVFANQDHPILQAKAKVAFRKLIDYVSIKIQEGMDDEEFNCNLNVELESVSFVSSLEGATLMSRVYGDLKHFQLVKKSLVNRINEW